MSWGLTCTTSDLENICQILPRWRGIAFRAHNNNKKNHPDYSYDANGNMTADLNKGISQIIYNHLNLPTRINFDGIGVITYLYNATGQKVQKIVENNQAGDHTITDYMDGFQYKNDYLNFFPTAEGYVNCNVPKMIQVVIDGVPVEEVIDEPDLQKPQPFNYVYNYTDHLGNIRLSYAQKPRTTDLSIIEENHYYPFGLKHTNYNSDKMMYVKELEQLKIKPVPPLFRTSYGYKYNGKELQDELGLNTYDYGFRQYMPDIGRMPNLDPLSELAYDITPNRYCFNNPLRYIDPSGLWEETASGYTTNKAEDIKRFMSYLQTENVALNNSPTSEQTSTFIAGEMSAGGHGKLSNGSILADELTIVGTKNKGENFKNAYADESMIPFWHGVQRSLTPDALDPRTVGQQFFGFGGLTYPGPTNPKTYAGKDDYSYIPQRIEEFPAITHDLAYDKLKINGGGGLSTATSAISADWRFVDQELRIASLPFSLRTKITAASLGVGLGLCALPKTVYSVINDTYQKVHEATK